MTRLVCLLMLVTFALVVCGPVGPARAEEAKKMSLDDAFKAASAYKFGQSREALTVVSDAIRDSAAKADERTALAKRLAGLLTSADSTLDARQFACRELSVIGTADQVGAITPLLLDKDLSDYARYALERIPAPEAVTAIRSALGKATGPMKIGMINSLGQRRDVQALAAVTKLLDDKDAGIAGAAAGALGKIGGPEAAKALGAFLSKAPAELKPAVTDAYLLCADRYLKDGKKEAAEAIYKELYVPASPKPVRVAALTGLVAAQGEKALALLQPLMTGDDAHLQSVAFKLAQGIPGAEATKALAAMVPKLPVPGQITLISQLGERGDVAAAPALLDATKSDNEAVRVSAIRALGGVGDASTVPVLIKAAAAGGAQQGAARDALGRLKGAGVDAALLKEMSGADVPTRTILIQALAARKTAAAVPEMLKALEDAEANIRKEAVNALGAMGDDKAVAPLVAFATKTEKQDERDAAEKALLALCDRAADRAKCGEPVLAAVDGAKGPAKVALLRVLPKIADAKALAAAKAALKDAEAPVADAALRVLADWPDAAPAPDLLDLAKNSQNATQQVLALRGYIDLAKKLPADRPADKLKMYKEAMDLAKRPDEKKMVLGAAGEIGLLDALKLVDPCIDDPALKEEASAAAVKIAARLGKAEAKDVQATMEKVLQNSKNQNVVNQARQLLDKAKKEQALGPMPRMVILAAPADQPAPPKYDTSGADKLGWRLAIQAWTFNSFTFFEVVDKAKALGIKYIEAIPGQKLTKDPGGPQGGFDPGMSDETIAAIKKKLDDAGVKVVKMGVCGIPGDEPGARKMFEWARKMGIETLNTEAGEKQLEMLDKLCEEYKINVSLHNHPKESPYWNPDAVLKTVEGKSKRIGSDADTGHWARSGLKPVECLKKLEGRVISLHFKDVKAGRDMPWGEGDGDAKGQLAELKRQGFKGVIAIEYESPVDAEMSQIRKCVEFFHKTANELAAEK